MQHVLLAARVAGTGEGIRIEGRKASTDRAVGLSVRGMRRTFADLPSALSWIVSVSHTLACQGFQLRVQEDKRKEGV